MIHTYSRRLLPPFSGQLQIAESESARALSPDGKNWEIQYRTPDEGQGWTQHGHPVHRGLIRVAISRGGRIERLALPSFVDAGHVEDGIMELSGFLPAANLPFPAMDHYEYWLLDGRDESPLALIHSCVRQEEMPGYPRRLEWTALSARLMPVERTADEERDQVPPVNYRLERMVAERAGQHPRTAWINRKRVDRSIEFPPLLVKEQWENEELHQVCQRYLARQAPRLLMLHDLSKDDRARLEIAARNHALEVARFYPLYPEVEDSELMAAIRVEARLRNASAERNGNRRH